MPEAHPLDRILFSSPLVEIGKFRVRAEDPRFHDSGPIQRHILVFPRTPVWIRHEGRQPFVANSDLVTYYNRGQVYRRDSVRGMPDRCEWFAFPARVLESVLVESDPAVAGPAVPSRFRGDPAIPARTSSSDVSSKRCPAPLRPMRSRWKRRFSAFSAASFPPRAAPRASGIPGSPGVRPVHRHRL